jgi:hypothetical protein
VALVVLVVEATVALLWEVERAVAVPPTMPVCIQVQVWQDALARQPVTVAQVGALVPPMELRQVQTLTSVLEVRVPVVVVKAQAMAGTVQMEEMEVALWN